MQTDDLTNFDRLLAQCRKGLMFDAESMRAHWERRKSMTRRLMKPQPTINESGLWMTNGKAIIRERKVRRPYTDAELLDGAAHHFAPWQPGDLLYCKETWGVFDAESDGLSIAVAYRADDKEGEQGAATWLGVPPEWCGKYPADEKWRSPMFMPRRASRLIIRVTEVRAERLQEISEADAVAEGMYPQPFDSCDLCFIGACSRHQPASGQFGRRWCDIHGEGAWQANPWVWVLSYREEARRAD